MPIKQDEEAIERWKVEIWPELQRRARREHRELIFEDESGFSLLPGVVGTYAPVGDGIERGPRERVQVSLAKDSAGRPVESSARRETGDTMTQKSCRITACLAFFAILLVVKIMPTQSQEKDKPLSINVEDIGTKVTLIGRLGEPLGKMMNLQGTWKYPEGDVKDSSLRFTVNLVNGHKLAKAVEFNIAQISARSGDGKDAIPVYERRGSLNGVTWNLRAYETGFLRVTPNEDRTGRFAPVPAIPYWYRPFTSQLNGTIQPDTSPKKTTRQLKDDRR